MPSLPPPEPMVSCFDDLDFLKEFENEFPAIVYKDASTSKSDLLIEPILIPQHIDFNDETSLSEFDEEEQNVLYFNDLFPFNIIQPDDLKSKKDNDDNEVDIIQSSGGGRGEGITGLMAEGLSARMLMEHRDAQGVWRVWVLEVFYNFSAATYTQLEGLHKGYDRFQSILSQLKIHGAGVSTEYANQKFLRIFKSDVKGSTGSSSSIQNIAFVSSESTNSTNDVSTAYGVSTSFGYNSQRENSSSYTDELMYSFFANQSSGPQLDHEDLEQLDEFDLEEMGLKWQEEPKDLVTLDGEGVDWTGHVEYEQENFALLAYNNSGSDTEVKSCSKECVESYAKLKKLYDEQREQIGDASIEIKAYTLALAKVEAQLVCNQKNQLAYEEKIRFMKIDLNDKTDVLTYHKKLLAEVVKEKEELKTNLENFQSSSKGLSKLLNSQMSAKEKSGLGYGDQVHNGVLSYENEFFQSVFDSWLSDVEDSLVHDRFANVEGMHAVPPSMTRNYMPPGPDREVDDSMFTYGPKQSKTSESDIQTKTLESVPEPVVFEPKVVSQPKVWSYAPIIKEYESDSDDEYLIQPSKEQEKPSFAFVNIVKHVKTPRETVKEQNTYSPSPKADKRDWNGLMSKRLDLGYGFIKKACFVLLDTPPTTLVPDNPERALKSKGIVDSGFSRHMTGNKAYLVEYQDYNGGHVAFLDKLQHFNLFSVSQMCDKKNKVLFTDTECLEEANHSAVKSSEAKKEGEKPNKDTGLKTNEEPVDKEERQRQEQASVDYIANLYDEVQAKIDATEELAARLKMEEKEMYTAEERSRLLAKYFENRKKQLPTERSAAIRNKPPTRTQLRSLMMTYLKHTGRYKHAQLNKKTLEEIQALYINEQERATDFVPIGSEEDERMIKKMNKKAASVDEEEVLEEPDSTKVKVKQEGNTESTRKRPGRRLKIKATKKSKRQKTDSDLEEEEQLKAFLMIVPDEEGEIDYEVLDKRLDFIELHSLVMKRFETLTPKGIDLILWGSLRTMFEENAEDDLWKNQEEWILKSWNFYDNCGVHILVLEDGTEFYMLAERSKLMNLEAMMRVRRIFKCWFYNHTTNGHQFTMSKRHQELASPKQTASGKDFLNPLMADSLPKTIWREVHRVQVFDFRGLPDLMAEGLSARMLMEHRDAQGIYSMAGSYDENPPPPQTPTQQAPHTLSTIKLPILKKGVSTEDSNQKFLRSLPASWSQVSLIMRTKPGIDTLTFDDLYNNLRVFKSDIKGSTTSSSSTQNVAFVSSESTNSTNDVSTAYGVSTFSGYNSQKEGSSSYTNELKYSFFATQSSGPQLDHEDLKQINEFDLEEMDLKWQVAMISIRLKKFYKKTGRRLQFDAKEPVGFDKTKVECFNCHNTWHFARECRLKENQESRKRDAGNTGYKAKDNGRRPGKQEEPKDLVTLDGEGVDWTG
ncbi:hypothetical protein Tco_0542466, partial [Tanacetum coccineum]